MPNGIAALGAQSTETPTTSLLLKIPAGLYYETPAQAGITNLLAAMLNESTKNYSTEAMSMALEKLGSQIYFSGGEQYLEVYVASLTKNLPATLALLERKTAQSGFCRQRFPASATTNVARLTKRPEKCRLSGATGL